MNTRTRNDFPGCAIPVFHQRCTFIIRIRLRSCNPYILGSVRCDTFVSNIADFVRNLIGNDTPLCSIPVLNQPEGPGLGSGVELSHSPDTENRASGKGFKSISTLFYSRSCLKTTYTQVQCQAFSQIRFPYENLD